MFNGLQWWHIVLIAAAFFLIFGAKKLPDAARGLGRSMRILKSEVSAMHDDDLAREGVPAAGANGAATAPGTPAVATPAIAPAATAGFSFGARGGHRAGRRPGSGSGELRSRADQPGRLRERPPPSRRPRSTASLP